MLGLSLEGQVTELYTAEHKKPGGDSGLPQEWRELKAVLWLNVVGKS
jgi:hypothetical protein